MSKKRVHEIAKEHGLSSKELLEKLRAAGVEAKAAASSVSGLQIGRPIPQGNAMASSMTVSQPRASRQRGSPVI